MPEDRKCRSVFISHSSANLAATCQIDEACKRVARNLTKTEWASFVGPVPYERTFADIPAIANGMVRSQ